jgi:hypothetical protein
MMPIREAFEARRVGCEDRAKSSFLPTSKAGHPRASGKAGPIHHALREVAGPEVGVAVEPF